MNPDSARLEHQRGNALAALVMTRYLVDKYASLLEQLDLRDIHQTLARVEGLLKDAQMPQIEAALSLLDGVRDRVTKVPALKRSVR